MNIKELKSKILKESLAVKKGLPLRNTIITESNSLSLPVQNLKMAGKRLDQQLFNDVRSLKHLHTVIPKPADRLSLYATTQIPAKIMGVLLWLEDKLTTGQEDEANPVEKKLAVFFSKLSPLEGALDDLLDSIGMQHSLFEDKEAEKGQKEYEKEAETEDDHMEFSNEKKKCLKEEEESDNEDSYKEVADEIEDLLDDLEENLEAHSDSFEEDPTDENIKDLAMVRDALANINDNFDEMFESKKKKGKK